jgi:hypothetical protein
MPPLMMGLLSAEDAGDRAGNVGQVVLLLGAVVAFIVVVVLLGTVAHRIAEMGWPLLLSGGVGFLLLIGGYIAGSSTTMTVGGAVMAASLGIALLGYLVHG